MRGTATNSIARLDLAIMAHLPFSLPATRTLLSAATLYCHLPDLNAGGCHRAASSASDFGGVGSRGAGTRDMRRTVSLLGPQAFRGDLVVHPLNLNGCGHGYGLDVYVAVGKRLTEKYMKEVFIWLASLRKRASRATVTRTITLTPSTTAVHHGMWNAVGIYMFR